MADHAAMPRTASISAQGSVGLKALLREPHLSRVKAHRLVISWCRELHFVLDSRCIACYYACMVDFLVSYTDAAAERALALAVLKYEHVCRTTDTGTYYYLETQAADRVLASVGQHADSIVQGSVAVSCLGDLA